MERRLSPLMRGEAVEGDKERYEPEREAKGAEGGLRGEEDMSASM